MPSYVFSDRSVTISIIIIYFRAVWVSDWIRVRFNSNQRRKLESRGVTRRSKNTVSGMETVQWRRFRFHGEHRTITRNLPNVVGNLPPAQEDK